MLGWLAGVLPLLLVIAVWEGIARSGLLPKVFLAPASAVAARLIEQLAGGALLFHAGNTLFRAAVGLALALVIGVALGLRMAQSRGTRNFLGPLISLGFPAPKIALFPILIVLFGVDHLPKVITVLSGAIFPILIMTFAGATAVDRACVWSALSMGSSTRDVFWKVTLPASLPYVFSGARIAVFVALLLAVVAEMVASGEGLGHYLVYSERMLETADVFVALTTISLIGIALDKLVTVTRGLVLCWAEEVEVTL